MCKQGWDLFTFIFLCMAVGAAIFSLGTNIFNKPWLQRRECKPKEQKTYQIDLKGKQPGQRFYEWISNYLMSMPWESLSDDRRKAFSEMEKDLSFFKTWNEK